LFGKVNFLLLTTLVDHAKCNKFFEAIYLQYRLDWQKVAIHRGKQKADAFEAYVGAVSRETAMYGHEGLVPDVRWFIHRLMVIRYQNISCYSMIEPMIETQSRRTVLSSEINFEVIKVVRIQRELGGEVSKDLENGKWNKVVGYIAETTISDSEAVMIRAFDLSMEKAKSRLISGRGKSFRLLRFC